MTYRSLSARFSLLLGTVVVALGIVSHALAEAPIPAAERLFFEEKVRPILVGQCYECHSVESEELGGKLYLDSRAGMLRGGESGPVLVPGKPEESLLIDALRYETFEMPPEKPLPETDIHVVSEWIRRGAWDPRTDLPAPPVAANENTEDLWSFQPRQVMSPPEVQDSAWPIGPIDQFVLHAIEQAGTQPTTDADLRSLARRLHFDLIGLPPTLEEVEAFVAAGSQDRRQAIESLVEKLLASPRFGEQWGRHWLDVARYGESNGNDGLSRNATFPHAWRYRDYVIDALNRDVPYDRFLTEQIAGDLLPAETAAERNRLLVATGFLAIGSKPASAMNKDFAMDVVDDQINAVSTAFLGLSVACARCHDHKHDPIPTRDYYAMAGIFQSSETLYGAAGNEKLTAPPTELHALSSRLPSEAQENRASLQLPSTYVEEVERLKPERHVALDQPPEAWETIGSAEFSTEQYATLKDSYLRGALAEAGTDYTVSLWFKNSVDNSARPVTAYLFTRGEPDHQENPGDHLGIGGKHDPAKTGRLFVFNGSNAKTKVSIGGNTVIPPNTWNHVVMAREGNRVRVYLNGVSEPEIDAEIEPTFGEETRFTLGGRSDRFAPLEGNLAHFSLFARPLAVEEAMAIHAASDQPQGVRQLGQAMGVREKKKPGDCKIHINGTSAKLGASVPRGALSAYSQISTGTPSSTMLPDLKIPESASGRLELAAWIADPHHPQTARVMVNRVWLKLMGEGLVATPDDFGVYGAQPTHPQLLDWLAQRFIDEGWSVKQLIREVVLSRTYQLSSDFGAAIAQTDPANQLWTRHRPRRLQAEQLRDSILKASGLLNLEPATGSPIQEIDALINKPPHEASTLHQPTNHRSIYLCYLRNAPPAELAAFDLPDGLKVTGQRNETVIPAQSLFLLNSPFVVENGEHLATRLTANESASAEEKIATAFQRTLLRDPTAEETAAALDFIRRLESAEDRLSPWGAFCQALFATNEFRYLD